jgi:hypothetical protein
MQNSGSINPKYWVVNRTPVSTICGHAPITPWQFAESGRFFGPVLKDDLFQGPIRARIGNRAISFTGLKESCV